MEKIQRIAARFITGDFRSNTPGSVIRLRERTGLPPLQLRRQHLRLTLFYRVVEGLVPALPPHQFLTPQKHGRLIRSNRTVRKDDFQITNIIHLIWKQMLSGQGSHHHSQRIVANGGRKQLRLFFSWLEGVELEGMQKGQ